MRIISWNVNGLRAREKNDFIKNVELMKPDILCLQEVRARPDQLKKETSNFLDKFGVWHISEHEKAGYAGVLVAYEKGEAAMPAFYEGDETGREYIVDLGKFVLINVYSPNAGRDLERLEHRLDWESNLHNFVDSLNKPVIICGDMNVAPSRLDCNVFSKAGTSQQERAAFRNLKTLGLIDVYRELYPFNQDFTWFSNQYDSRTVNKGMRIDHFLISKELRPNIKDMKIMRDAEYCCGSDHAPIILDIDL